MMTIRTVLFLFGALAALFLSPWVTAICIVALSIRYRAIEAVALGALIDFLWLPHDTLFTMLPLCTIVALVVVWGFEPLRLEFLQ
jgi:hypothetical protein